MSSFRDSTDMNVLTAKKPELLVHLLKEEGIELSQKQTFFPREHPDDLPASFAQRRLWFLDQLEPGSPVYNIPVAVRLTGSLNVVALEQSLNEIVRRHESLRTTFAAVEGRPMQVIRPELELPLPLVDLRDLPETKRESEALRLAVEEALQPFDLVEGPLLRVRLLQLDEEEHILFITVHHIVSDAWSIGVLVQEIANLYEAFSAGRPSPLRELPIQYADFAHWQLGWLQREVLEAQLAYWKEQLEGSPPLLELPTDRPRPAVQTFQGMTQTFELPKSLAEAIKALSHEEGATLFMTLLAAFQALLYRYTGQEDINVGTPIANRNRAEIEGLIGLFVNTLVIRADLSRDPSFQELLERVREAVLGAYAHRDLPFEILVDALQPERDMSHSPLFQVMFVLQNAPVQAQVLSDLTLSPVEVECGIAKFDLTLSIVENVDGLSGSFEYNTDLFDAATIERMVGHFQTLLESIVANPDQLISKLPLLTEAERQQLLVEWNATAVPRHQDLCVHEFFEAQVERTPGAVAMVFESEQLTYAELNGRANQLAHYLQKLGVEPETLVGISVERSLDMVVGLLGVLKAGGAYLPLDPTYPQERLAFMLEDAQVSVLVTQEHLVEKLLAHEAQASPEQSRRVLCLDADREDIAQESEENPVSGVTAENLAYVIYTSGSTGKPKGVMIPHRGLVNHALTLTEVFGLSPGDHLLQFISLSFDASAEEIFPTLLSGATLVLPPSVVALMGADFLRFCEQQEITVLHLPASFWHQWVDALVSSGLPVRAPLKVLLVGGESPAVDRLQAWSHLVDRPIRFLNAYGPTEATITTTLFETTCDEKAISGLSRVPIGRPITNVQVYLLDRQQQLVPVGVPGEIYIGGTGVARGYLNRPELTAEKFVPDPFSGEPGARLYKTGDLARYLPDGNIEFLGRADHQVKVRGFRIELSEIEAVLSQHPALQEAVVLAREDTPGDKRLVAYAVPNQESAPTLQQAQSKLIGELRSFLKARLPEYMAPSAFVLLEALPLTPNGKVDRRALPKPDRARFELDGDFMAPRNEIEAQLAQIWEELLEIRPIGVRDNFFELGGHSLLAVRLATRVEDVFGTNIPLTTLFQEPTIEQLAEIISQQTGLTAWPTLVAIQPQGSRPPFFCVHPLCGDVIGFNIWARYLGPDQPFYGLRARGLDGVQEPWTQIEAIAADYIEELQTVQLEGPYHLGGYAGGSIIAFEMAQQLHAQGHEVALLVIMDQAPINSGRRRKLGEEPRRGPFHRLSATISRVFGRRSPKWISESSDMAHPRELYSSLNSDYFKVRWGPRFAIDFLKNLPYWLNEFLRLRLARIVFHIQLQLRPAGIFGRIQQKVKLPKTVLAVKEKFEEHGRKLMDEHDQALLDHDNVPRAHDERQEKIAFVHAKAMLNYVMKVYPGHVTVFRTRKQPLFCSFAPDLCWGELAAGGVDVREIDGSTLSILKEPHARVLAEQLKACLDEAQARA